MSLKPFAAAALVAAFAVPAGAQSLAEIAERTRKKREAEKKPGAKKVITENDLGSNDRGTYSPGAGEPVVGSTTAPAADAKAGDAPAGQAAPAGQGAAAAPAKTDEELAAERLANWRERMTKAQEEVTHWTSEANRLQEGLNDMTGPLYGPGRAARQNALEEVRGKLAAAQQTVADLTEEGRRNSFR